MATLTTNISPGSVEVTDTTQRGILITWTCPTVPDGATINSCTLTGIATANMSKGSATIKINNQTVSSGSTFTIDLGTTNTISKVNTIVAGGNKNASGTVTFSNLVYTVNYTEPVVTYTVTFKDWDGTVLKTETVESGKSATAPANPTRTGYEFTGWSVDFTNVTSDIITIAQYKKVSSLQIKENGSWTNITRVFKMVSGNWVEQNSDNWENLFDTSHTYVQKTIPIIIE